MPYIHVPWGSSVSVARRSSGATTYDQAEYEYALRKYCGGTMGVRKVRTEYFPDGTSKDIWQDVYIEPLTGPGDER